MRKLGQRWLPELIGLLVLFTFAGVALGGTRSPAPATFRSVIERGRATKSIRVAWVGTSITGGLAVNDRDTLIDIQVNRVIEKLSGAAVISKNFAFGGALSLLQVALLKQGVLPWRPDLIIAELGTLDQFYEPVSLPSIEAFMRIAKQAGIPLVVWFPFTEYAPIAQEGLLRLAAAYGYPALDMPTICRNQGLSVRSMTLDGAHPNEAGRSAIVKAFYELFHGEDSAEPMELAGQLLYRPDMAAIRFIGAPVQTAHPADGPRYFDQSGAPFRVDREAVISAGFNGHLLAAIFRVDGPPGKLAFSIDGGKWRDVPVQPAWFLAYVLSSNLKNQHHELRLKINPRDGKAALLDGFIVNDAPKPVKP